MQFIATLVGNKRSAKTILRDVPNNSVVLFPESLMVPYHIIHYYSRKKNLFIIHNHDTWVKGRFHITMKGVDCGKLQWMVHKYFLWRGDYEDWDPAPRLDPIVNIRGHPVFVAICYELAFVAGFNRLFTIGKISKKALAEVLLMPADWRFNWQLPQKVLRSAFHCIPSLKAGLFSCRRTLAFASTRNQVEKITKRGWVSVDI